MTTPAYRGRLAPSPTGYLHFGHAHTFWRACQRAQQAHGILLMRIEDLDPDRCKQEYADTLIEDLRWLGIPWQEGELYQSQRRPAYLAAWQALMEGGYIYPCSCSRKDLANIARAPHEAHEKEPVYPGTCRPSTSRKNPALAEPCQSPAGINWRFRVPDGETIAFLDSNLGPQQFTAGQDFGDFLIWSHTGVPAYQLACVVDDAHQRITEVVRGADLLISTARQILLARALGLISPSWYHCQLITDEHGQRLAKRHDALSLRTLRQQGATPASLLTQLS